MNPVDLWFNRAFPPWSGRRLAFGLVGIAVIGWLIGAAGGEPVLPRFLIVTLAAAATLAIAYVPSVREAAGVALGRRDEDPELPPPFAIPKDLRRDLSILLPFASSMIAIVVVTAEGLSELLRPSSLLTIAIGGLFTGLIESLRTSAWALIAVSLLGGVMGWFAMIVLSAMTFSEPHGFLAVWAIGSALCLLFLFPIWQGMRRMEALGLRLPMWVVMGGATLLTAGASLMVVAE